MSDDAIRTGADDTVAFLARTPLLGGMPEAELAECARVLRPRDVPAGEILWREGDQGVGIVLIVSGRVSLSMRLPGGRAVELGTLGAGESVGELPLIDGGGHAATARVVEPSRLLSLGRADLAALLSRGHPLALTLGRRFGGVLCGRLRGALATLADLLGGDLASEPTGLTALPLAELEPSRPPESAYVRRLAAFHAFDGLALFRFLTSGQFARCAAGRTLLTTGEPSTDCYLTINGAVEKIIVRGARRIRVGLAGPGQAFGYESLIDGGPGAVTAVTRERTLLLRLSEDMFDRLFHSETVGSHAFLEMINREVVSGLRQALRAHARLAASVDPQQASRGGSPSGTVSTSASSAANVMNR
jgi:CRP-like cAMP-binding protein